MNINTASEAISFAKELENSGSEFYRKLAEAASEGNEAFESFAQENEKFIKQIERAYYSVISDAIEGGFAFDFSPEEFRFNPEVGENLDLTSAVKKAQEVEKNMINFYQVAAEQSQSLMADVPRAFNQVVKKRNKRLEKLEGML